MDEHAKPVSRFWACFFAVSELGFLWTGKMRKTGKWFCMVWLPWLILFVQVISCTLLHSFEYYSFHCNINSYVESHTPEILHLPLGLFFLLLIPALRFLAIYKMWVWSTAYNMNNFGHKSKKEWKEAKKKQQ